MNIQTEFVKGGTIDVQFIKNDVNFNYEFVMPQTFQVDFKKGSDIQVAFLRPNNTLEYEFSIGKQGPKGDDGARGSLWTSSAFNPSNNFGEENDIHLNYSTYDLFQKIGGQWTLIGNIKGPVGPAGNGEGVLPAGGTTGQRLAKLSNTDFDVGWVDAQNITYIHTQASTATVWTVTHNLNKYPAVTVVATNLNPEGVKVYGDIEYVSENQLTITFVNEIDGKAYLN